MLYGRDAERARVAELLADARANKAGALVIRGEPGVGKSALAQEARAAAEGMLVLAAQGLESEAPLAFAGLHQLLRPVLPELDRLPAPQARALRVAFGMQDGPSEDPFLVALGTLTMLSEAADTRPVLCVVDDAHWLDVASADALLFAARRLQADPIALIFTARDGDLSTFAADGIPTLVLTGLDVSAGRQLLAEHTGTLVSDQVAQALLEQTAGNPLALVELPTALSEAQLQGTAALPPQLQLTDRVQHVFLDRCRRLSVEVQTLMLVAAADDSGNLAFVTRAAAQLGASARALAEAERAGLLITDRDSLRMRHPLLRSAVYQASTGHERRAAHRALADVLTEDPDRRAWHQAAAAEGPDAEVVAALDGAAGRAERRGGYRAAAAAYERAAELSVRAEERAQMLFAAARNAWSSGDADRARRLAETANHATDDSLLRADIDRLLARVEVNVGSAARAYRIFVRAARSVMAVDSARAVEMWVAATLTQMFDADTSADFPAEEIPEAATREELGDDPRTRCLRLLLAATIADNAGEWALALRSLQAAVAASGEVEDADVLGNLGNIALHLGDDDTHRLCFTRMVAGARDRSAGMLVLYALPRLAFADLTSGHWSSVRSAAEEALRLSNDTGQSALGAAPLAWLALLSALQGSPDYDQVRIRLDSVRSQHHLGVLSDAVHDLSRWAAGVRAANDEDAHGALRHLTRMRLPALSRMAAVDRLEAAVRAGEPERARVWVEELAELANITNWPWARAAANHGRALLADPADAPALFDDALAYHDLGHRPYDRARTHLAYGTLLRRTQRRSDARPQLRAALAIFHDLGAEPYVARAEQELRASGETARKRDPSTLTHLTPMELQVAQLVADGMSNKEAATHCWISPRTVAFHLRNVFAKTGISSRGELARLGLASLETARQSPGASR